MKLLERPQAAIMGIINTTPDSFSDGGQFHSSEAAIAHGLTLIEEGADILDIGGESTRPGAASVGLQEELDRVLPVIEGIRRESDVVISIDTSKAEVMLVAVKAGANFINDVKALQNSNALNAAAQSNSPVCLMHMQGDPSTMQAAPHYSNPVDDVVAFLLARIDACAEYGITRDKICVDPGIGFGKTLEHNLQLLNALPQMRTQLGCEVLIGVSRKAIIGGILERQVDERLYGSVGLAVQAALNGAKIIRVHDVRATSDAIRCAEAVAGAVKFSHVMG